MARARRTRKSITYAALKAAYRASDSGFAKRFAGNETTERRIVAILARAHYDGEWPLGMLKEIRPQLAAALRYWTAGGWENIRMAQEGRVRSTQYLQLMRCLEEEFKFLPRWRHRAFHYSHDPDWHKKLRHSPLILNSFMSCCSKPGDYAWCHEPRTILEFQNLRSARLVGALTTEPFEKEILLPRGTIFEVCEREPGLKILLTEIAR